MRQEREHTGGRLAPTARILALVLGLLSPSVAFGHGLIHELCAKRAAEPDAAPGLVDHAHHHHGGEPSDDASGDRLGCTWLGPCAGSVSLIRPDVDRGELGTVLATLPVVHPAAEIVGSCPLAFLRPLANPPPASS